VARPERAWPGKDLALLGKMPNAEVADQCGRLAWHHRPYRNDFPYLIGRALRGLSGRPHGLDTAENMIQVYPKLAFNATRRATPYSQGPSGACGRIDAARRTSTRKVA